MMMNVSNGVPSAVIYSEFSKHCHSHSHAKTTEMEMVKASFKVNYFVQHQVAASVILALRANPF